MMLTPDEADKIQTLTEWRYIHSVCLERIEELKTQLAKAEQERDEYKHFYEVARDGYNKPYEKLLAENRLLREAIETIANAGSWWDEFAQHALDVAPLTAAEVERVKRLEAVAEAAKWERDTEPHPVYCDCPLCIALAALEVPDADQG